MVPPIVEYELAEDLKELIAKNPEVQVSKELEQQIKTFDNMAVVKTEKQIGSPTKILSAVIVDE